MVEYWDSYDAHAAVRISLVPFVSDLEQVPIMCVLRPTQLPSLSGK